MKDRSTRADVAIYEGARIPCHATAESGSETLAHVCDVLGSPARGVRPRITLTYAQSLDGCIAAKRDTQTRISNAQSEVVTHRMRAVHDAILVGVTTVLVDDPRLTVRLVPGNDPTPVIVDSHLRTPPDARVLGIEGISPIIATTESASESKEAVLSAAGAEVLRFSSNGEGLVDLDKLLAHLRGRNIRSLMIEGGARVITNVMLEQLADQLVLFLSPIVLGGLHAVGDLRFLDQESRPRLRNVSYESVGEDLILYGEFERFP